MKKNREYISRKQSEANDAKMKLISIYHDLLDASEIKEAEKLEKIIIKLEVWQNS